MAFSFHSKQFTIFSSVQTSQKDKKKMELYKNNRHWAGVFQVFFSQKWDSLFVFLFLIAFSFQTNSLLFPCSLCHLFSLFCSLFFMVAFRLGLLLENKLFLSTLRKMLDHSSDQSQLSVLSQSLLNRSESNSAFLSLNTGILFILQ